MAVARGVALALLAPVVLAAQEFPKIVLKPSTGSVRDTTATYTSVRELSDGRVITPGGRRATLVLDFKTGTSDRIPDVAGTTYALAGDTTAVTSSTGWILLNGTHVLGMLPSTNPVVAAAPRSFGFDQNGSVLAIEGSPDVPSVGAVLIDRNSGEKHEVTRMSQGPPALGNAPAPVFVVSELPVLALDGWIAVVRVHPLRVDWRTPTGQWVLGKPFPIAALAMDAREQAALQDRQGTTGNPDVHPDWPALVEPFVHDAPIATPDGKVLVKRTPTADAPLPRYDVVNRRGEVEGEVTLKGVKDRIAGFGAKAVYLWVTDAVASTRAPRYELERHPWP